MNKFIVLPVLPFFRFVYSVVLFSGLPAVFPGAVYSASCVVGAASGWPSNAMHLSTSRIKRLTRAIALLWSGAFPASPWLSCTRASSLPSSFTCICKSRFSLRRTSRSAAVSLQRAVSRRWSAMSCRICASKSLMTFFSAIYLSPEIFSAFPKVYKKRQTTKFYFMIISFRVPRYGKRSGPIPSREGN